MFEWLWAMNTNQLIALIWLDLCIGSCCSSRDAINERRYNTIVEKLDKIERKVENICKPVNHYN